MNRSFTSTKQSRSTRKGNKWLNLFALFFLTSFAIAVVLILVLYLHIKGILLVKVVDLGILLIGSAILSAIFAFFLIPQIAERAFRKSLLEHDHQWIQDQVQKNPLPVVLTNIDGIILLSNEPVEHLFGYGPQELKDLSLDILVPASTRELRTYFKQKEPSPYSPATSRKILSLHGQCKNGDVLPLEITFMIYQREIRPGGKHELVLWTIIDNTVHRLAQNTLSHSLSLHRVILDTISDAVFTVDDQFRPISYNQPILDMWHLTISDGQTFDEIVEQIARQTRSPETCLEWFHATSSKMGYPNKTGLELKDGRHIEASSELLQIKGISVGRTWKFRDITQLSRMELSLQKAESDTKHASGELARMVYELEHRAQESMLVNEMSDSMQLCTTREEAYEVVKKYVQQFFPETLVVDGGGALSVILQKTQPLSGTENARVHSLTPQQVSIDLVRVVQSWGSFSEHAESFPLSSCWALRRNRMHSEDGSQAENLCHHIGKRKPANYVCIPLISRGEALGVLTLLTNSGADHDTQSAWHNRARQNLLLNLGERISLALVNLNLRESLREQAIQDSLTGLFNRRYLEMALEREIRRNRRHKAPLSVIMLDIDHFKNFNDTYGHQAGDYVLREVANVLLNSVRLEDVVSRYGGEEFLLILPGSSGKDATRRAEQIRRFVQELVLEFDGAPLSHVTLSIGVAELHDEQVNPDDLIRVADDALYTAKSSGRNRVIFLEGIE